MAGITQWQKHILRCPTAYSWQSAGRRFSSVCLALAQQLNLHGDVCNDGDGVEVRLLEDPETFLVQLHQHCPPLARIDSVEREPFIWSQLPTEFTIRQSTGGTMNTQIVPDAATCPACLAEMNTRASGVIVIRLSTVLTVARVSPLFAPCLTTARLP